MLGALRCEHTQCATRRDFQGAVDAVGRGGGTGKGDGGGREGAFFIMERETERENSGERNHSG